MGQILSNSEVEAILAGLDLSPARSAIHGETAQESISPYDFEHPLPLHRSQMSALRLAAAAAASSIQARLAKVLNFAVSVNFLGIEQSTFRDYLETAERPGCIAVVESPDLSDSCLLDVSRPLAFAMIDCLLGGDPSASAKEHSKPGPFTSLETRLVSKGLEAGLPELVGCWMNGSQTRITRILADASLFAEQESNEAVALVSYEVNIGNQAGIMQLCLPWKQVAQPSSTQAPEEFQETLRNRSKKLPLRATATLTSFKLSARDLADLRLGDILLTDTPSTSEARLSVDGSELFRGTVGQNRDRKVIRLTGECPSNSRMGISRQEFQDSTASDVG